MDLLTGKLDTGESLSLGRGASGENRRFSAHKIRVLGGFYAVYPRFRGFTSSGRGALFLMLFLIHKLKTRQFLAVINDQEFLQLLQQNAMQIIFLSNRLVRFQRVIE